MTDYNAGDTFKVRARYEWLGAPDKDYTVKVYSKQNLEIKDSRGQTSVIHMDGQAPSGFTASTYRGMNPSPIEEDPGEEGEGVIEEPESLTDLFAMAFTDGNFNLFAFLGVCF